MEEERKKRKEDKETRGERREIKQCEVTRIWEREDRR
jgi:hypothetical protein